MHCGAVPTIHIRPLNELARQSADLPRPDGPKNNRNKIYPKFRYNHTDKSALETNLRAESNLPIVTRAVREDNFVANIHSQPDGAKKRLDSAARIESPTHVIRSEVVDTARKSGE